MQRRRVLGLLPPTVWGRPLGVGATALGVGTAARAQAGPALRLLHDFPGANCHPELSTITDAGSTRPRVHIEVRNPEGGRPMWQAFRFALTGCRYKTIEIEIPLAGKEGKAGFRREWSGPYVASRYDEHDAWQALPRSVANGVLRFTIYGERGDTLYVASMPPNALPQCLSWMNRLVRDHPGWVHDDLPSRRAANLGRYTCGRSPAATDELRRSIPPQPLLGLRVAAAPLGASAGKRRFVIMANVHPSEDHGPLQMRGFVAEWLRSSALEALRTNVDLIIYPLMAANGSFAGYRRHEPMAAHSPGSDLNRQFTGRTANGTALAWRHILARDLDAEFTRGGLDFHDLSAGGKLVWVYHPAATPEATLAAIRAEQPQAGYWVSKNPGTTMSWLRKNTRAGAHATGITAEVSDEAAPLAAYLDVGARWARVCGRWLEAGLMG